MLKVYEYVRQLLGLKRQTDKNTEDIDKVVGEVDGHDDRLLRLEARMDVLEQTIRRDFENLVLRLENQLLKYERRLPHVSDSDS